MANKFAAGVTGWSNKLGLVRDAVRQELVTRQLREHLPPPSLKVRILDIGCGQGTQVIQLAGLGYTVIGVDPSRKLLDIAKKNARQHSEKITFVHGTLENLPKTVGDNFDVVCCHGVLMYLPELDPAVRQLVQLARPGGLISVLTRNRAGIAMRAGMKKDWQGALDGFDARYYKNNVGIENVRADEPQEVIKALQDSRAELIDWYGVRLFTDHWKEQASPKDFNKLLEAEYQAGKRDPYRQLTALTHVIARRRE